jgi:murein DD-endopeptidase MepM/ murein hydrolase activator NlpD
VACKTDCPARAAASTTAPSAQVGSTLRVRGSNLADALRVIFPGGAEARPAAKTGRWLDVAVPAGARSGRLVVKGRYGMRSKPSPIAVRISAPAGEQPASSSSFGMPLPAGFVVSSQFWEARSYERHPGVDLAIDAGTPINAVGAGTVTTAGYAGGYGNYTCIRHTASVTSCYAHQSAILVQVGQSVARGQVIGRVGCTGSCTGPHLHFEIRIDGSVVCPAPWVGASSAEWCDPAAPGYGTRSAGARALARSAAVFGRSAVGPPSPAIAADSPALD